MPEYSIPIMFDVEAPDRDTAGRDLVRALADALLIGAFRSPFARSEQGVIESWWTIEAQDKKHDGNDNDAGHVEFEHRRGRVYLDPHDAANPFRRLQDGPLLVPHEARPDDLTPLGHRCKDCGEPITWMGPNHADWAHVGGDQ